VAGAVHCHEYGTLEAVLRNGFSTRFHGASRRQESQAPAAPLVAYPITPWTVLKHGLIDGNTDNRRQAMLAAGSIGATPEAVKFIEEGLKDKETIVRQTAATVLGQLKAPDSIPALRRALGDNAEVAFTAAKALTGMGDTEGQSFLIEVLTRERKDKPGFIQQNLKNAKKQLTPYGVDADGRQGGRRNTARTGRNRNRRHRKGGEGR
jgi:HEAT repeat protein